MDLDTQFWSQVEKIKGNKSTEAFVWVDGSDTYGLLVCVV